MLRIDSLFEKALFIKEKKGWEKIYVAVDIHDTMMPSTYSVERPTTYYPYALECLKILSEMTDVCLILWTCSNDENNIEYMKKFTADGIKFQYLNENPECPSTDYACFDKKMYLNVILDDKAGFEQRDWKVLHRYLSRIVWRRMMDGMMKSVTDMTSIFKKYSKEHKQIQKRK